MRKVVILGSTGSIGVQALEIVRDHPGEFSVVGLAAGGGSSASRDLFARQCQEFLAPGSQNAVLAARDGFEAVVKLASCERTGAEIVLNAIAGNVGLLPSLEVLASGGNLALANKESLVIGGTLLKQALKGQPILERIRPVDSEHSAIWQCLGLESQAEFSKLILTASGGPFRGMKRADLANVTPSQALNHPTWSMGPLVTVNSSTLMNKGLELIEAAYLFGAAPSQIDVTIHPQSVVHSMVQLADGAVISQQTPPSMKLPIALALSAPRRLENVVPSCSWDTPSSWQFEPLDEQTFPAVRLAREAFEAGPLFPLVMNAANEQAVGEFLRGELAYLEIIPRAQRALESFDPAQAAADPNNPTLEETLDLLSVLN